MNSSSDNSEIENSHGVACGRAIRSYCTGLSHVAGIRFYP